MAEPFIAEIVMFGGNFAPRGWAFCDGQLLAISQNSALFSLLGTTYGGDGRTTFGLPDLRGRFALHPGSGPGLPTYRLGQRGGATAHVLSVNELPSHDHSLNARDDDPNTSTPAGNLLANSPTYAAGVDSNTNMKAGTIGNTGNGQQFSVQNPFLAVNFIIALTGVFPSRS
jgi:microcystin-dependent protein